MLGKGHYEIKTAKMARQKEKKSPLWVCTIFNERYLLFKWKKKNNKKQQLSIRIWAESQNQIDIIGKAY